MTFGSLFAGIGGMDLGLERAGMVCKWQVEIDPFCQKVLTKHWPEVPKYGDIRTVEGSQLERVDVIAGGFPCQDISTCGNGAGITGARSGLWLEMRRLVRQVRPEFVIVENVSALLVRGMGEVLGDLAESGYDAEWDCLPAATFNLPHFRDRAFIVANNGSTGTGHVGLRKLREGRTDDWKRFLLPGRIRNPYGIPSWVDRSIALGNAVVPQVAEYIGRRIMEAHELAVSV